MQSFPSDRMNDSLMLQAGVNLCLAGIAVCRKWADGSRPVTAKRDRRLGRHVAAWGWANNPEHIYSSTVELSGIGH